jgi:hypothetical protein
MAWPPLSTASQNEALAHAMASTGKAVPSDLAVQVEPLYFQALPALSPASHEVALAHPKAAGEAKR